MVLATQAKAEEGTCRHGLCGSTPRLLPTTFSKAEQANEEDPADPKRLEKL